MIAAREEIELVPEIAIAAVGKHLQKNGDSGQKPGDG
jgi:hypothetical protein